jgi:hypothetical protein
MIGPDKHDSTSFKDLTGRSYIWMFIPKDCPCSEWSMHHTLKLRIDPFRKQLGDQVVLKRDQFLVMGENEKDLLWLASATTYAVQKRPWLREIDLWKSFVNVDVEFLEGLDKRWWE